MKERYRWLVGAVTVMCAVLFWCGGEPAKAAQKDVVLNNGMDVQMPVYIGDSGTINPVTEGLVDYTGQPVVVDSWHWNTYGSTEIQVDANGRYKAVSAGETVVRVTGYSQAGSIVFTSACTFVVGYDMTNVTLEKDHITGSVVGYEGVSEDIHILRNGTEPFDASDSELTYTSSNAQMSVSVTCSADVMHVSAYSAGSTTVTVVLNGKTFTIQVHISTIEISKRSYVSYKGKTFKLKVKGTSNQPVWISSNALVAKVSSTGKVRLRRYGNAVITAEINGKRVGCAVSVLSAKRMKVIRRANFIGKNWKYSQPKRMLKGYYDCSSLVWKAYSKMGKSFGSSNYAPVAADLAKWCKQHGKVLTKSYTREHIQNMKFRPGDLMFETGQDNGRYKGIYHVEMFTGYAVSHYDELGNPVLNELWAARPEGAYGGGHLIERP